MPGFFDVGVEWVRRLKRILPLPLANVFVFFFLLLGDSDRHVIRLWLLLAVILVWRDVPLFRGDVPLFLKCRAVQVQGRDGLEGEREQSRVQEEEEELRWVKWV